MSFHIQRRAMDRRAVRMLAAALLLSPMFAVAQAQAVVRGILYDDAKGTPVRGTVMLVDPATDAPVVHVAADSLGQFDIRIPTGTYQLAAVREGYTSVLSAPIPLENGELLTLRVPIAAGGDPQHHIGVLEHVRPNAATERQRSQTRMASDLSGFNNRKMTGLGLHYDRAAFDKSGFRSLGEFLQNVPGLQVMDPNSTSSMSFTRSPVTSVNSPLTGSVASCHMGWFVDGRRIDLPGQRADAMTDALGTMTLESIEGVEVFRGLSEMPSEFADPDLRCGAIAIWSRKQ
jgi:hypothetical protein